MFQKTFVLTERSLRVEVRGLTSHLLRFLVIAVLLWFSFVLGLVGGRAVGRQMISFLAYANAVLISLLGTVYFGSCLTEEKEERTLPLLLMADISPLALLSGRILPRMLTVFFILGIQIPFSFFSVTLGGILMSQILAAFLVLGAYMLLVAGIGTLCSVVFRLGGNAIGATGFLMLGFHLLPALLWLFATWLTGLSNPFAGTVGQWLFTAQGELESWSVYYALLDVLSVDFQVTASTLWLHQFVSNIALGLAALGVGVVAFPVFNANLDTEPVRQKAKSASASSRSWAWAIVWKEYRLNGGGNFTAVAKLVIYGAVLALTAFSMWYAQGFSNVAIAEIAETGSGEMSFFLLIELLLWLANTYTTELKEQTWGTLSLLPVSMFRLVYEKLWGTLIVLWPALTWLVVCIYFSGHFFDMLQGWTATSVIGLLIAIGQFLLFFHIEVFLSILLRNTWGAIVLAAFLYFLLSVVGASLIAMLVIFGGGGSFRSPDDQMISFVIGALTCFGIVFLHVGSLWLLERAQQE